MVVDPRKPFFVETDASANAVGVVLLQDGHPVAFESKKLNNAQCNYSAYERELYAIVHALKKWRHYLYGATFDVLSDQESIKWFMGQKDLKGQKARWAEVLQEFDCNLRYCKGLYNVVVDVLSHMPEVESLSFIEIKISLLNSLRGQYEHDQSYEEVSKLVLRRDPSPMDSAQLVANDVTPT